MVIGLVLRVLAIPEGIVNTLVLSLRLDGLQRAAEFQLRLDLTECRRKLSNRVSFKIVALVLKLL